MRHSHAAAFELLDGAKDVTIERCWVHDPNSRANSWRYYHPYGPSAVGLFKPEEGIVIRYNDFVGSVNHWWNDAVACCYNKDPAAGFNRDGDLDGNFLAFSNDDGVEFDGGGQNVRAWGNRFEECLMGLSFQFSAVSPVYAVDNAFTGLDTEHGLVGASIKLNSMDAIGRNRAGFIADNVFARPEDPPYLMQHANAVGKPRLFITGNRVAKDAVLPTEEYPKRPIPYLLDRGRIDGVRVEKGAVAPSAATVTLTCGGTGYEQPFKIAKGDDATWFDVTPREGTVRSGEKIAFTVTFDPAKMSLEQFPRSAFLVRTADGFSRPVTIIASTDRVQPVKCEKEGEVALYGKPGRFEVEIPKEGTYYVLVRGRLLEGLPGRAGDVRADVTLSSCPYGKSKYSMISRFDLRNGAVSWGAEQRGDGRPQAYHLKPGPCTVRVTLEKQGVEPRYECTDVVVTDSIGSFDPLVGTPGRKCD